MAYATTEELIAIEKKALALLFKVPQTIEGVKAASVALEHVRQERYRLHEHAPLGSGV